MVATSARIRLASIVLSPSAFAASLAANGWTPLPEWLGASLAASAPIAKGAGHKYLRKVPTGHTTPTGKPIYRYYYQVTGGHQLGHDEELREGAAFRVKDGDKEGHFHIRAVDGDQQSPPPPLATSRSASTFAELAAIWHRCAFIPQRTSTGCPTRMPSVRSPATDCFPKRRPSSGRPRVAALAGSTCATTS